MRAGGTHKTALERTFASLRAQVGAALDNDETVNDPKQLADILRKVEQALRGAELQLASGRLQTGEHPAASTLDAATLEYVKAVYTEEDEQLASNLTYIENSSVDLTSMADLRKAMTMHHILQGVENSTAVAASLERAGQFDFNALHFSSLDEAKNSPISISGLHLLTRGPNGNLISQMSAHDRFDDAELFQNRVWCFFQQLDALYSWNTSYHGHAHAVDVMSTSTWFLMSDFMQDRTNPLERFMMLIASAIHDVGHMGRNNMFYTKTLHDWAIRYSDKSVLEHMHLATSFEIMKKNEDCNWHKQLKDGSLYVRQGLISMVLSTDPSKHNKHMKHFGEIAEDLKENPGALSPTKERKVPAEAQKYLEDKLSIFGNLLHAADVSNPTKEQSMMLLWTSRLLQEFWAQGDEEKSLGLPISPLCDRSSGEASVPQGQLGFVNFVIKPFFVVISGPISITKEALEQTEKNVGFWEGKKAEGATYDQLFGEQSNGYPLKKSG